MVSAAGPDLHAPVDPVPIQAVHAAALWIDCSRQPILIRIVLASSDQDTRIMEHTDSAILFGSGKNLIVKGVATVPDPAIILPPGLPIAPHLSGAINRGPLRLSQVLSSMMAVFSVCGRDATESRCQSATISPMSDNALPLGHSQSILSSVL